MDDMGAERLLLSVQRASTEHMENSLENILIRML
jgi:hypothetical protein